MLKVNINANVNANVNTNANDNYNAYLCFCVYYKFSWFPNVF